MVHDDSSGPDGFLDNLCPGRCITAAAGGSTRTSAASKSGCAAPLLHGAADAQKAAAELAVVYVGIVGCPVNPAAVDRPVQRLGPRAQSLAKNGPVKGWMLPPNACTPSRCCKSEIHRLRRSCRRFEYAMCPRIAGFLNEASREIRQGYCCSYDGNRNEKP